MNARHLLPLASIAILLTSPVHAQSWNYQTYNQDGPSTVGQIVLEQRDSEYQFQFVAPGLDSCYQAKLKASVEKAEATMTITPVPRMPGCEQIRFVLQTDGTGGKREMLRGTTWVPDRVNRLLTLRN